MELQSPLVVLAAIFATITVGGVFVTAVYDRLFGSPR